ncbi:MAG TPA: glycosyltransferase family 4 protein [Solirubrobacteraceae bacterium]|nr:glycosyltransferase family 4 protein [Solirubrobacteraceae bacterium]
MRLALLTPAYWPEVRRGTERFAHDLGAGLAARGHEVRLVTSHRGRRTAAREDGMEVVRVPRLLDGRLRRRLYEDHLTHVPFTAYEVRDEPLAHALFHTDAAAARMAGVPYVYSFMGVPHRKALANRRGRAELVRRAIAGAHATVALSEAAARGFERWLGISPHVIHPGVDLAAFTPGGDRAEDFTIVCPAALDAPHKRAGLLLEAFARVRTERPRARLVLDARAATAVGPLPAGVELRDLDDHTALLAAYREAHVCALASEGEAFGLVLVEALACGTPAVASDDAAGPEITGTTFAGDDPQALATAILDAASEDPRACRERAERFSLDRFVDAYEALYREALR